MQKSGFRIDKILKMKFRNGWKYLTLWKDLPADQATWEPLSTFTQGNQVHYAIKDFAQRAKNPTLLKVAQRMCLRHSRENQENQVEEDENPEDDVSNRDI